jgi:ribosomal protein L32
MANIGPKKKITKTQKHTRFATWLTGKLKKATRKLDIVLCTNCGATKLNYRACTTCGWYGDKQVMTIRTKSSQEVMEA